MQQSLIVLTFREPLRGRDLQPGYLPSDLLWGALYATDARLQDQPLPVAQPFRVSSAFPYVAGEWLLPRPRALTSASPAAQEISNSAEKKAEKGLRFVMLGDFLRLARGERLEPVARQQALARQRRALLPARPGEPPLSATPRQLERTLQASKKGPASQYAQEQYGAALESLNPAERTHLTRLARGRAAGHRAERQRNTQDRVTAQTDTFVSPELTPPRLAFVLETPDEGTRARLLAALRLLADNGLGGQRSHGSGQFVFETCPLPDALRQRLNAPGPHVLLSLACPSADEARQIDASEVSRYGLIRRGGYLDGSNTQRRDVWMLTEGRLVPGPLAGTLPDVAPPDHPHPVYRSGLPLSLAVGE